MKALPHQVSAAEKGYTILNKLRYVYVSGLPRTGKTLIAILIAEQCQTVSNVLVLTKKQAIPGWLKFITSDLKKNYLITNYEQLGNVHGKDCYLKYHPNHFDLVIIDESHNIGTYPKPSNRWKVIRAFCQNLPHIHLSGTPMIESKSAIYHQMTISKYTPFTHKNFYEFFREWGVPTFKWIKGQQMMDYSNTKPDLLELINKFTVYISQEEAGIDTPVQDKVHYIELAPSTKALYNKLLVKRVLEEYNVVCDSVMKLRIALHMLESGVLKIGEDDYIHLENELSKVNYIKNNFGDTATVGIMAHFVYERTLLEKHFKNAKIFSSNAHAEGVDLSYLTHFIIFSSDYSGAKFVQRRERIANINGSNTNTVHHLIIKNGISDQVYRAVSKKKNFNDALFVPNLLS